MVSQNVTPPRRRFASHDCHLRYVPYTRNAQDSPFSFFSSRILSSSATQPFWLESVSLRSNLLSHLTFRMADPITSTPKSPKRRRLTTKTPPRSSRHSLTAVPDDFTLIVDQMRQPGLLEDVALNSRAPRSASPFQHRPELPEGASQEFEERYQAERTQDYSDDLASSSIQSSEMSHSRCSREDGTLGI